PKITPRQPWHLSIADRPPAEVVMYGFGGENGRGLRLRAGTLINPLAPVRGTATYAMQPALGDSGGGAWSPDGYFAGVLVARDGHTQATTSLAYIVRPDTITDFLERTP